MGKLIFLTLVAILLCSTFIYAQAAEDTRYGLLEASKASTKLIPATKYTKDNLIRTETRIGVVESLDPNTGKIMINSLKNEGGIKTKDQIAPIVTSVPIRKPLKNELARTNLGKKAVAQETKITQQQTIQKFKASDLSRPVTTHAIVESPFTSKNQNPMRVILQKIWNFLKG